MKLTIKGSKEFILSVNRRKIIETLEKHRRNQRGSHNGIGHRGSGFNYYSYYTKTGSIVVEQEK